MAALLLLFVVVLAVEPMGFDQPHLKLGVLLLVGSLILFRSAWSGRLLRAAAAPLTGPARVLGLLLILSTLTAVLVADNRPEAFRSVAVLLCLILVLLSVSEESYEKPLRLPAGLLLSGLLVGGLALLQAAGFDFPFRDNDNADSPVSWFGNTNLTGEFLAPLIPLAFVMIPAFRGGFRAISLLALAVVTGGVIVSGSRGALLAGGIALLACPLVCRGIAPGRLFSPDRLGALVLGGVLALACGGPQVLHFKTVRDSPESIGSPEYATNKQRLLLAESAVEMIRRKPWFGHGPGSFRTAFPPYRDREEASMRTLGGAASEAEDPHNQYLLLLAEGGGVALLLWLLFLLPTLFAFRSAAILPADDVRRHVAPALTAALLGWLVIWMFRCPLQHAPSALMFFMICGALLPYRDAAPGSGGVNEDGLVARILPLYLLLLMVLGGMATAGDLLLARSQRALENNVKTGDRSYVLHAERCLNAGVFLDPSNFYLLQWRSEVFRLLSRTALVDLEERQSAYEETLRYYPWNTQALIGLASLHLSHDRPLRAQQYLRKLARLRPAKERDDVEFLVRVGQPEAAACQLLFLARSRPVPTSELRERADRAEKDGQVDLAIACLEALLELRPFDGDAAFKIGELETGRERHDQARRMYARAQLGFALEHLGSRRYDEAGRAAAISARHAPSLEADVLAALAALGKGDDRLYQEILSRLKEPLEAKFAQELLRLDGNGDLREAVRKLAGK
ncbi:MAG: O-antigen ligase family protein [Planctomycetota bacterium]